MSESGDAGQQETISGFLWFTTFILFGLLAHHCGNRNVLLMSRVSKESGMIGGKKDWESNIKSKIIFYFKWKDSKISQNIKVG